MNSALYTCQVMHNRLAPKKHKFTYKIFMFWLNIDALDDIHKELKLFSRNNRNVFCFRDKDHFKYANGDEKNALTVREKLNQYLSENKIEQSPANVFLLTNVRMFGYVFNPVSFYYCFDEQGVCTLVLTEISNTFGEMKIFLTQQKTGEMFMQHDTKYFYVSPFTEMDTEFEFRYKIPAEKLNIQINVKDQQGKKFLITTLNGNQKKLSDGRLFSYIFRFPFVTLKVIFGIHWQAMKLWLKKIPYHKKNSHQELQKEILNK